MADNDGEHEVDGGTKSKSRKLRASRRDGKRVSVFQILSRGLNMSHIYTNRRACGRRKEERYIRHMNETFSLSLFLLSETIITLIPSWEFPDSV